MSQSYFYNEGDSSATGGDSSSRRVDDETTSFPRAPPEYITVGNGITSAAAEALMASLGQDSGYGGSVAGDGLTDIGPSWRAGLLEDRETPSHTPTFPGELNSAGMSL
jgi:mitofusin 2